MKKLLWRIMTILIILISWVAYSHPDWVVDPPFLATAYAQSDKGDASTELNPNRPYFDGCGNEYDYMGNLIKPAIVNTPGCPNVNDNSTDVTPVETSTPVNSAITNANVSDFEGK